MTRPIQPPGGATVVHDLLADAERRCAGAGQRLTDPRRRVLELLVEADRPVKAYDLMRRFAPGRRSAKPPTVYRALDFLQSIDVVHPVLTLSAFVACQLCEPHIPAFLVCDVCGGVEEFDLEPERRLPLASRNGFLAKRFVFEARGVCSKCSPPSSTTEAE